MRLNDNGATMVAESKIDDKYRHTEHLIRDAIFRKEFSKMLADEGFGSVWGADAVRKKIHGMV